MSQIDVASKSSISTRTSGLKFRAETFVREFEWTWTNRKMREWFAEHVP